MRAQKILTFLHILNVLFLPIFWRYFRYFIGTNDMYRQTPNSTDKTSKRHYGGGGEGLEANPPPPPRLPPTPRLPPPPTGYASYKSVKLEFPNSDPRTIGPTIYGTIADYT